MKLNMEEILLQKWCVQIVYSKRYANVSTNSIFCFISIFSGQHRCTCLDMLNSQEINIFSWLRVSTASPVYYASKIDEKYIREAMCNSRLSAFRTIIKWWLFLSLYGHNLGEILVCCAHILCAHHTKISPKLWP